MAFSTISLTRWMMVMWLSWILAEAEESTTRLRWVCSSIKPPWLPLKPMVFRPSSLAFCKALMMLGELPLVLKATRTSPGWPKASTCFSKTASKPKSLAKAVNRLGCWVKAMQGKNIPVTYVLFPDEGHGFARPENRLSFDAVTEAFLAANLGGRAQPVGEDFAGATITVPAGAAHVPGLEEVLKETRP